MNLAVNIVTNRELPAINLSTLIVFPRFFRFSYFHVLWQETEMFIHQVLVN